MSDETIDRIDKWLGRNRDRLSVRAIQSLREIGYEATEENKTLKESRNDLLRFLSEANNENCNGDWWDNLPAIIQKAEALMVKETK